MSPNKRGGKIAAVEMLTERKALVVRDSYMRGGPPLVDVDVCLKCASVVFDVVVHDNWHRTQSTDLDRSEV